MTKLAVERALKLGIANELLKRDVAGRRGEQGGRQSHREGKSKDEEEGEGERRIDPL